MLLKKFAQKAYSPVRKSFTVHLSNHSGALDRERSTTSLLPTDLSAWHMRRSRRDSLSSSVFAIGMCAWFTASLHELLLCNHHVVSVCVRVNIRMCIYICVCVRIDGIDVCVCLYEYIYIYVMYVMYVMYVCMHACMDVCLYVCMYLCMYVCIHVSK